MTDRELMQQALDALEEARFLYGIKEAGEKLQDDLRARLAQPEQDDGYCQACDGDSCTAKEGCVARDNPPQREWQGLTDEEITETLKRFGLGERAALARAIEAKLKEKNND